MQSIVPISPPGDLSPIVAEVDRQLGRRVRQLRIEPCAEGVVLKGTAPSFYVKQLALHAAGQATPWRIVRNDIEVLGHL